MKMKLIEIFRHYYLLVLPFFIIGCNNKEKDKKDQPNIIMVMADDQGWGDVGYNGHPELKTPNLDKMAGEGLQFNQFYAAAPVSSPTRASFLTGRHPNRMGVFKWGNLIRPQEITVAEVLKKAGYVTGHFGKWHVGSVYEGCPTNPGANGFDEWLSAPNFYDNNPILSREGTAVQKHGESSMIAVNAAIEFIRKHHESSQPFFSVIWFGSPHVPHRAIDRDKALYPDLEEELQNFYGEITGIDRAVGKLRDKLRSMDIEDNTVLWYLSDNGGLDMGWDKSTGGRGSKGEIYEGGLRVPSIIEWPARIQKHRETDVPAVTSDIYPTLLEIADLEIEKQPVLDGISLIPLIKGEMEERDQPVGFWEFPEEGRGISSSKKMRELWRKQNAGESVDSSKLHLDVANITTHYAEDDFRGHAAWLDWPFKFHRIEDDSGNMQTELYNLEEDPMEQNDLSDENNSKAESMRTQLEKWQSSVIKSLNGRDYH